MSLACSLWRQRLPVRLLVVWRAAPIVWWLQDCSLLPRGLIPTLVIWPVFPSSPCGWSPASWSYCSVCLNIPCITVRIRKRYSSSVHLAFLFLFKGMERDTCSLSYRLLRDRVSICFPGCFPTVISAVKIITIHNLSLTNPPYCVSFPESLEPSSLKSFPHSSPSTMS